MHTRTLAHTIAGGYSTWLGDHQGIPSSPTNSLHDLHMTRYQVIITIFIITIYSCRRDWKRAIANRRRE